MTMSEIELEPQLELVEVEIEKKKNRLSELAEKLNKLNFKENKKTNTK